MVRNWSRKKSYIIYTAFFLVVFFLGFVAFFVQGKSFVWKSDGYRQYYPVLHYLGSYYRNVIRMLFTHPSQIPMIDYTIGQGEDIITTFANYGLGDPLTLSCVFVPARYTEYLYDFLVGFRLYLSGLSFLIYCQGMKWNRNHSVCGALAYAFCGFAIWSVKDPFFLNALIYLPLILLGIEWIIKKKSPVILAVSVLFCVLSGYYFFYMIVLCALVYFAVRVYMLDGRNWRELAGKGCWCLAAGVCGILMSGILILPVIYGYLASSRTEAHVSFSSLLTYDLSYYKNMFVKFIAVTENNDAGAVGYFSVAVSVLVALVILVQKRDRVSVILRNCVIVCILAVASPFVGYVFNGFGYITNRFMFIPAFLLAVVLVHMMPELIGGGAVTSAGGSRRKCTLLSLALYSVVCLILSFKEGLLPACFMVLMLAANVACLIFVKRTELRQRVFFGLLLLNLIGNINLVYQSFGAGMIDAYMDAGSVRTAYVSDSSLKQAKKLLSDEEGLTRMDVMLHDGENPNQSIVAGYHGVSVYYSIINSGYCDYMMSLENTPDLMYTHRILGNDGRAVLENLSNVKYVLSRKKELVPYGFERVDGSKNLYVNKNDTSIGYTCSSYVSTEDYDKAEVFERQNILLNAVVADQDSELYQKASRSENMTEAAVESEAVSLPLEMRDRKHFLWENGSLKIDGKNGSFCASFTMKSGKEYYLRLGGLEITKSGTDSLWANASVGKLSKSFLISNEGYDFYFGRKDYLVCLGSLPDEQSGMSAGELAESGERELKFRMNGPATYRLETIELVEVPVEGLSEKVGQLYSERLYDVKVADGGDISGRLPKLTEEKLFCLSIPYKKGYTLYVDGKEKPIERVNKMYIGAWLDKGEHEILLTYETPGLKSGGAMSVCGIGLIVLLWRMHRKYKGSC